MIALCAIFLTAAVRAQDFVNRGFQKPALAEGEWVSRPVAPNLVWQGDRSWGIANGATPWGLVGAGGSTQYAYIQSATEFGGAASIYQTVSGLTVGQVYRVSFRMAQRFDGGSDYTGNAISVVVDDSLTIFGPSRPTSDGAWVRYSGKFVATSTTQKITWQGQEPNDFEVDVASLIDQVRLEPVTSLDADNSSFQQPALASGSWISRPGGSNVVWQGDNSWGIANGVGSWGTGGVNSTQYGYIQSTDEFGGAGSIYKTIGDLTIGQTYKVSFWLARRNGNVGGNNGNTISVYLDDDTLLFGPTKPTNDGAWVKHVIYFTATDTIHKITFQGQVPTGTEPDTGSLLDRVNVVAVSPTPRLELVRRSPTVHAHVAKLPTRARQTVSRR
jgi:hypothetical protein